MEGAPGAYTFRMVAGNLTNCYASTLKANVETTDTSIVITPVFPFAGCGDVRFNIRKDGSGGVRELKNGDQWIPDGRDRNLTLQR